MKVYIEYLKRVYFKFKGYKIEFHNRHQADEIRLIKYLRNIKYIELKNYTLFKFKQK